MDCYYSTDSIISMLNDFSYSLMFSAINQFLTKGSSVSSPLVFFMLINLEISKIYCIFVKIIIDFFMSTFFFNIYIDRVINKIDTNEKL